LKIGSAHLGVCADECVGESGDVAVSGRLTEERVAASRSRRGPRAAPEKGIITAVAYTSGGTSKVGIGTTCCVNRSSQRPEKRIVKSGEILTSGLRSDEGIDGAGCVLHPGPLSEKRVLLAGIVLTSVLTAERIEDSGNAKDPVAGDIELRRGIERVGRTRATYAEIAQRLLDARVLYVARAARKRDTSVCHARIACDDVFACGNTA
jgi:hypothetical protein